MPKARTRPSVYASEDDNCAAGAPQSEEDRAIDNYTAKSPSVRNGMTDRYLAGSKSRPARITIRSAARRASVEDMTDHKGPSSPQNVIRNAQGEGLNADFHVSRVNPWSLMRAIVLESVGTIAATVLSAAVFFSLDIALNNTVFKDTASDTWLGMSLDGWRTVGAFMPEVVFAVVGIALSIVSLILQLSATRYSPFVVELFFRDKVSKSTLNFFVTAAIFCVWVNVLLGTTEVNFIPRISCVWMMITVSISSLMIIPFFKYVFAFISPKTQIDIMVSEALTAALDTSLKQSAITRQTKVLDSVQHLSEYALSAVHSKDAAIAFHCVNNMGLVVLEVMRHSASHQVTAELFAVFRETDETLSIPAFENVNSKSREEVYANWLLWMVLYELNSLFTEANSMLQDACQQITSAVLAIGVEGVAHNDMHTVRLVMKFFNTFMRTGVNGGNIKLCCRVLNHYRKLVEGMMRSKHLGNEVVQGVQYMTYYAHIAYVKQVYFIAEIVAYDISMICETAFNLNVEYQNAIVSLLLEVDEVPDDKAQLETLRGVRKAQIKLATFYLLKGEVIKATMIRQDMADEPPDRLNSIRDELEAVESATFWELEDRGYNFEYLSPERRLKLEQFLALPMDAETPNLSLHEKQKRRMTRSQSMAAATEAGQEHARWLEAQSDLTTPHSTPSSMMSSRRRGLAGVLDSATPASQQRSSVGKASIPGTVTNGTDTPGVSKRAQEMTPLIARIPEESLRASIEASKKDDAAAAVAVADQKLSKEAAAPETTSGIESGAQGVHRDADADKVPRDAS